MQKLDNVLTALERMLGTAWVGAMWSIGYLAVPVLFSSLDNRMLAGSLAGQMFSIVSYLGLGCGLLLIALMRYRNPAQWLDMRAYLILFMLLLVVVGEFILQPMMAELKRLGLIVGSEQAHRFAVLHGIASVLYLVNSLAGLILVSGWSKRPTIRGA